MERILSNVSKWDGNKKHIEVICKTKTAFQERKCLGSLGYIH